MRTAFICVVPLTFLATIAAAQGLGDHLKCEKVSDPLKLRVRADIVNELHPELSAAGCTLSRAQLFCSPASPVNVAPPPAHPEITGASLGNDFVCYKAQCPVQRGVRAISDAFGTREQRQIRTSMVCVPAGCVPTTCAAVGANCSTIDDGCGGTVDCGTCIDPDMCGGGGVANVCGTSSGPCAVTSTPPTEPLGSTCRLAFPTTTSIPCPVPESGAVYFVSATTGNDANDGTRPDHAWATLCHALQAAPNGSTVRAAEGTYTTAAVTINRPLTVKGGYDSAFAEWDPDRHRTIFTGALRLAHDDAVFGGFRMIGRPVGEVGGSHWAHWHQIEAGTLVRNYIEVVYQASVDQYWLYAILASAPAGSTSRMSCNDIYVRGREGRDGFLYVGAVEYGQLVPHLGHAELSSNRICLDGPYSHWADTVIDGMGTCATTPASIAVTNNVVENAVTGAVGSAVEFYGCNSGDLQLVFTNNTVLSASDGLTGYAGNAGMVRWTLANNILVGSANRGSAVAVGTGAVEIASSIGNLAFGFADNGLHPAPRFTSGDDTRGGFTASQVFVDAGHGDFGLLGGGPGVGTGVNVYDQATYGSVTSDLMQRARPASGAWDRGALAR